MTDAGPSWDNERCMWVWQCPACPIQKMDRDKSVLAISVNSHRKEHQPHPPSPPTRSGKSSSSGRGFWDGVGDFFEDVIDSIFD